MKVSVLIPSYNRPHLLGQAVAMFLAQDYPGDMEIIVLEDSGIFGDATIHHPGWTLVSTTKHYPSVGAKRNALIQMCKGDIVITGDDDDTYFPWHVSAAVKALEDAIYCQPRQALEWDNTRKLILGRYWVVKTAIRNKLENNERLTPDDALDICYGGQWSFQKESIVQCGGYPEAVGNGDDTELCRHMVTRYGNSTDTICDEFPQPSYIYSRHMSGSWHASELGPGTRPLDKLHKMPRANPDDLNIRLPDWYYTITIPTNVRPRKW